MEKKLKGLEEHVDYLYEELEGKEKEIDDLKKMVKETDELCRKNTAYAQEMLREKCSISLELEKRKEEIKELKSENGSKCHNQCSRMDEVLEYANKNKNDAISVKEIADAQKIKIACLRGHRNELLDKTDTLKEQHEVEINSKDDSISHAQSEMVKIKEQLGDYKDELDIKSKEIEDLKKINEKEDLKTSSNSLHDEISIAQLKIENEKLEHEVEKMKVGLTMQELQKKKKSFYLKQLGEQSEKRYKEIKNLQNSIKQMKPVAKQRCIFKWECKRWPMCKFDHSYLHRKVNNLRSVISDETSSIVEQECLCELCGQTFVNPEFGVHVRECHVELVQDQSEWNDNHHISAIVSNLEEHNDSEHEPQIRCQKCGELFHLKEEMESHLLEVHQENDVENLAKSVESFLKQKEEMSAKKNQHLDDNETVHNFQCQICHETFRTKSILKRHKKRMHYTKKESEAVSRIVEENIIDEDSGPNYACVLCKVDFKFVEEMDQHMDDMHEGRWKIGDEDVIWEGDDYEESDTDESMTSDSEESLSDEENSEN